MIQKPRIVLLDLGGVVFQSTGISNDLIQWPVINKLNWKYGHDLNTGKDKFPDFLRAYNQLTDQQLTGAVFLKAVFDTLEINTELIAYLGREHEIIIVSDNYRENIAYISQRYDFASWAVQQFYSFDYKMVKAHPRFFAKLLADLSMYDRESLLFIDDSPEKIASAEAHGIRSIRFENNAQLFKRM